MIYIGIDNGFGGGIVGINERQEIVFKYVMPIIKGKKTEYDIKSIVNIFKQFYKFENVLIVLEKAHVRPVSGKRACFMTGFGYGVIQGIIESQEHSYEIISPKIWMNEIFKGHDYKDKKASIKFCQRKWPKENWCGTEKSRVPHTGLTDATCMALYCYRMNRKIEE